MPRLVPGYVNSTATANVAAGSKSVGTASVQLVPAFDRSVIYITNTSTASQYISIGLGTPAIAGQGIVLAPGTAGNPSAGSVFALQNFSGVINVISSASNGSVAFVEI